MLKPLPLQTPGSISINIEGLNKADKDRIARVGLTQWMDEASRKQEKRIAGGRN